jgi:hypothetical protein
MVGFAASLFMKGSNDFMFLSGASMAGFSWWCYRFGRRNQVQREH